MDSITQAALGAAVGEAVLGRKVGYRAALWGAIAGTIPDLDVLANPLLDEITQLSWHRGYSHSLLFTAAFAPLLAWVIRKMHGRRATWREWTVLTYLVLVTHIALDCFTFYGTQLFLPFSSYRVAFNNIAIVDPLYTAPLLLGVIAALFLAQTSGFRRWINYVGLVLCTLYLLATVGAKYHVDSVVEAELHRQGIAYERYMTAPTIFNAVLWRATVEDTAGYRVGHYSLFDQSDDIEFRFIPRNGERLQAMADTRAVKQLLWFSNGYYTVTEHEGAMQFHDLRFGEIQTDYSRPGSYLFTWNVVTTQDGRDNEVGLRRAQVKSSQLGRAVDALWTRLKGY